MTRKFKVSISSASEEKKKTISPLALAIGWGILFILGLFIIWLAPATSVSVATFLVATLILGPIRARLVSSLSVALTNDKDVDKNSKLSTIKCLSWGICSTYALLSVALYKLPLWGIGFLAHLCEKAIHTKSFLFFFVILTIIVVLAMCFVKNNMKAFIPKHLIGLGILEIYITLLAIASWCGVVMWLMAIISATLVALIPTVFLAIWGLILKKNIPFL